MLSCHWTHCVDQYLLATAEKNVLITQVNKDSWLITRWFVEISKSIHAREVLFIMLKFYYPETTLTVNNFRNDILSQAWYMKWYMNIFMLSMYINVMIAIMSKYYIIDHCNEFIRQNKYWFILMNFCFIRIGIDWIPTRLLIEQFYRIILPRI